MIAVLSLIACSQATTAPTPVEEIAPDLAFLSPTDVVPTIEGTIPNSNSITPTTLPLTETPMPSPTNTPLPSDTQPPTPTEGIATSSIPTEPVNGFCDPALEAEALEAINQRRAEAGAAPLVLEERLVAAARRYSEDMGTTGAWDHIGSDSSSPFKRIHDAGYNYSTAAENISAGHNRGLDAVEAWMNSDGHRKNMLNPTYIHIGLACFHTSNDTYTFYWTAVFATP